MASVSILGVVVYGLGACVLLFSFFVWLVGCFSVCVVSVYFILLFFNIIFIDEHCMSAISRSLQSS